MGNVCLQGRSREKIDPLEKLSETLYDHMHQTNQINHKISNKWLEYTYMKQGLDTVPHEAYRDLVELASAIDWIEDEQ